MDTHRILRHQTTIVRDRPRAGLVSPGKAWRYRNLRKELERARERDLERRRAWADNPDNPMLTAKRRTELLAAQS